MSELLDESKSIDLSDKELNTIYITGGGFIRRAFRGIGADSQFGWQEMVWKTSPTRGGTFAFTNMDDIDVGLVARCELNIMYMNTQDYMDLRKIIARERHFTVDFFDIDAGKRVSRDMYCSSSSRSKLHIRDKKLLGVANIPITFVGTNLDTQTTIDANGNEVTTDSTLSIVYNITSGSGSIKTQTTNYGQQVVLDLGDNITPPSGTYLSHWQSKNLNGDVNGEYGLGQSITVWKGLTLYPVYELA